VAERVQNADHVAQQIQKAEAREIGVVARVPTGGAPVAALVGSDRVITRCGQRRQDLAPAIGELGKAVQQQDRRPAGPLEAGLEDVDIQAVDVGQLAGADAIGKD
jgi:hypothetical protein